MGRLLSIGETLLDFIPQQSGLRLKDVTSFRPALGGAPTNVCGAFSRLGGNAAIITQLGEDAFGDKIIQELNLYGIDTSFVRRTASANSCLAFVSLAENGQRDFSFYRNPSADMLLSAEDVRDEWFDDAFCLHFCSVSLGDFPMKYAHDKAIEIAKKKGALISFDPNLRFPLWKNADDLKKTVWEFIPRSDILKISDEELPFLTDRVNISEALEMLFVGAVKLIIYTKGADGAEAFTKQTDASSQGIKVNSVDTTGAGDAFIGSFLYQISKAKIGASDLEKLSRSDLEKFLKNSNSYSAKSTESYGAIPSYPESFD